MIPQFRLDGLRRAGRYQDRRSKIHFAPRPLRFGFAGGKMNVFPPIVSVKRPQFFFSRKPLVFK
jgi:hypothetical protein